jgi:hypothetical protein
MDRVYLSFAVKRRLFDDVSRGQNPFANASEKAAGLRAHAIIHAHYRDNANHESGATGAAACLAVVARQLRGE